MGNIELLKLNIYTGFVKTYIFFFFLKGWYNRKDLSYIILEDIIVLSAMGPPGGGRTFITPRCLRHFNILTYTELDEITIVQIFSSLTTFFLKKFNESVREQIPNLISSVLHIYDTIRVEMLPTPSKSHYTFNLRDIWKVKILNSKNKK